ncbi:MAG TPA: GAF domain-containing protein [Anaerolineae bacterium]|nr:GAF domain-containing protein [Anaerolineae bacterium]
MDEVTMMRSLTSRLRTSLRFMGLPVYPDEERARAARLLLAILSILLITAVAVLIVSVLDGQSRTAQIVLTGSMILPFAFWLLRRGHLQAASLCVVLVLLSVLTYLLVVGEGIHDIALTAYPTVIVISSLLLGRPGAVIGTVLSIVAVGLVFVAESQGVVTNPFSYTTSPGEFAILVALLCLVSAMVELLASNTRRSLKRARRNEHAQVEANRELQAIRDSLEQRVAERTAQLSVSAEVSRAVTSVLDPDDVIRRVAQLITERFGFYYAAVFLLDDLGRFAVLREAAGAAGSILKASQHRLEIGEQSMVGAAIASRQPHVARNVGDETMRFANPLLPDTQSEVALPLLVGDRVLGALDVQSRQLDAFDENSLAMLQSLADQIAIALNNAQQYQEAQLDARQATALFEASRLVGFISEDLSAAADHLLRTVAEQAGFDSWTAAAYEADSATYTLLCAFQDPARRLSAEHRHDADFDTDTRIGGMDAPNALAIRMRQAVVINDPEIDPLLSQALPAEREAYGRSVSVPAVLGDRVVGAISLGRAIDKRPISARDVQLAQAIANQLAVTIENRRLFEQSRKAVAELNSLMQRYTHEGWARFSQADHATVEHEFRRPAPALSRSHSRSRERSEGAGEGSRVAPSSEDARNARGDSGHRPPQTAGEGRQPALAVPIELRGEVIGMLDVQAEGDHQWSQDELVMLKSVADQVAQSVEAARLLDETEASLQETVKLYEASRAMAAAATPAEVMHTVVSVLHGYLEVDQVSLVLFDEEQEYGRVAAQAVPSPGAETIRVPMAENPGALAMLADGRSIAISHLTGHPVAAPVADLLRQMGALGESFLVLPLVVGQRLIGFVGASSCGRPTPREFRDNEIAFCETLSRQAAVALENRRLFEETRYRAEIESTLNRISQTIKASLDPQTVLDLQTTIAEMGRAMRASRSFYLANVDDRRFVVAYEWREAADNAASLRGVTGVWMDAPNTFQAFKAGEPLLVSSVERQGVPGLRPPLLAKDALSHMHVPVVSGSRLIGVLGFDQVERERRWLPEEVSMVRRVADQLAAALENARLYQDVRARVNELTALTRIGRRLAASLQLEEVLNTIVEEAINITPADRGSIALYDPIRDALELRVLIGFPEAALRTIRDNTYTVLQRGDGLHGRLLTTGQAVLVNDVLSDPAYIIADSDTRAELIVPIRQGETLLGALNLESPHAYAFGEPDQRLIEALADQAAVAIANARAYEAERAALDRMREVDRLKTQFLANMSHELRTPLNSIIGFSRVILRGIDGPLTEMQQADLTAIHNSGQHLLGLINDVLDLSKIEAGKMELASEDIDLAEVVRGVMSTAIALIKDRKIELHQEIPPDLPLVRADPRRIRQVVLNLVSNAAKFTETGRITTRVIVGTTEVWVSVVDTGIGIQPDKLEHIFEEFTQVDPSTTRKAGGTGLGLAISRKFVEMHGGRIWAESQMGVGSTFTFTLPLARPALHTDSDTDDTDTTLPLPEPGRPLILCIDDDPEVITLYRRFLEKQGYQVIGLRDTERAVQEAARLKPATIILDVLMPAERRDGWSILAELKSTPATRDIPIVVCTIVEDQNKGFALGAADYLVKPVSESDLMRALDRASFSKAIHTVLVVDDELDAIRLLRRMLEGRPGVNVIEAQGGAMGIAAAQTYQPDLVLLDLMMPDIDGFAVLETIRGNRHTHDIPVIVVTAKDVTEEDRARLHGKVVAMLNKGALDSERLMNEIAAALARLNRRQPAPALPRETGERPGARGAQRDLPIENHVKSERPL